MPGSAASRSSPRYDSRSHRRLLFFILKCAIMFLVIFLFLFFLGFAAIVVVHFLFMSTAFHRRRPKNEFPRFQAHLHDVVYRAAAFPDDASDCAICLDPFREGEQCRDIPSCKHLFHGDCLDRWIRKKPNCPVCRSPVQMNRVGFPGPWVGGGAPWKRLLALDVEDGGGSSSSY